MLNRKMQNLFPFIIQFRQEGTGDREQVTGDREQGTGDREQGTGKSFTNDN